MSDPEFPSTTTLSRASFEEGVRHLEDACILHKAGRYPAAIASAMKAAEFSVKSIVMLDGAMGWWDKVFTTHSPFTDINSLPMFDHHIKKIATPDKTLGSDIIAMEALAPARPGGAYDIKAQQNPEYPFLSYHKATPAAPSDEFRLNKPSTHFGEDESKKNYNIAQKLLTAVAAQYAVIGGWNIAIPEAL